MISLPWKRLLLIALFMVVIGSLWVVYWRWGHNWLFDPPPDSNHVVGRFDYADRKLVEVKEVPFLNKVNLEMALIAERVQNTIVGIESKGIVQLKTISSSLHSSALEFAKFEIIGSGVIVTKQGHIITNNHVINGCNSFLVTLHDGKRCYAEKLGSDPERDIAVLKIMTRSEQTPLPFGDSDKIRLGELVTSFGNVYGLGVSMSKGIISAKTRYFDDYRIRRIQTDISLHPGHSGGPLINVLGEIIGLNTSRYNTDKSDHNEGNANIGFAIPSNDLKDSFRNIVMFPQWVAENMGLDILNLHIRGYSPYFQYLRKNDHAGVIINSVAYNSVAKDAGIKPGDIIVNVNDKKVDSIQDLNNILRSLPLNQLVKFTVWRGWRGKSNGELKEFRLPIVQGISNQKRIYNYFFYLTGLNCQLRPRNMTEEQSSGFHGFELYKISVRSVLANKLKVGDIIESINGIPLLDEDSLMQVLKNKDNKLVITFYRYGKRYTTTIFGIPKP